MQQQSPDLLAWILAACAIAFSCEKGDGGEPVRVDGSSTVFPIMEAVASEFQKLKPIKISVAVSGTSGGFAKFCAGKTDISNASRPIQRSEAALCASAGIEYVELPVAYDGLSVLVHPKNNWANDITTEELKKIWEPAAQGTITKWSQVRPGWPDSPLHLYGAGVDSGTYDYFTEAIVHKEHSSRSDYTSSEDDNALVQGVAGDELALGFFGYLYYAANKDKLKVLPVDDGNPDNGAGPITPSPETVRNGTYQPLSRPLFIYVAKASLARSEVGAFVNFYLERGWKMVGRVGYMPLPIEAYPLGIERVSAGRTGSLFARGGSQVGVSIAELLRMETEPVSQR
jgi:phosphate transport system substrate-binding protein